MEKLTAAVRTQRGKIVKILRQQGFLPAVVYGADISAQPITIGYRDFEKALVNVGESTILELNVGGTSYNVLIHDVARDPIRGVPVHADFYAVRMDKPIRIKVPIEFAGESPAVKDEGGILIKVLQEIEVEALPSALPKGLRVEIGGLAELGARLFVKDIIVPPGVQVIVADEEVLAVIEAPRSTEELEALAGAPEVAAVAEVKTEQEVKRAAKEEAIQAEVVSEEKEKKAGI